jgi:hypothetical protein
MITNLLNGFLSRREMLKTASCGIGLVALADLCNRASANESLNPLAAKPPHFKPRAKRVIFMFMQGAPSHVDTFDYKPQLQADSGKTTEGKGGKGRKLMKSPFKFTQHGQSGLWFPDVLPNLAEHADDLCLLNSMYTDIPAHPNATLMMHTGNFRFVRPSMGAWTLYGLGSENANLPGFIALNPPSDNGGARNYGSGFLPAICQGTKIGGNQIPGFYAKLLGKDEEPGPPLKNIENRELPRDLQRAELDLVQNLNRHKRERDVYHPEIDGAIESFELAFRMQDEVPELLDLRSEPSSVLQQYGVGSGLPTERFGRQCILARRLAEAGVRFIEITAPVGWDHHFLLKDELTKSCEATDQPIAALLTDLKARGLLQDTLVIWAGEFGRTPYSQSEHGRDHNNQGYTIWMAGGGVKPGLAYGATDEYGYKAVEKPVHIHDWHATILHLLGLDHERLTFNYGGRDFRLTDVYGNVVKEVLA